MRNMQWQLGILGTISAIVFRHRETKKNLCRGGRSQDLLNTDFQPAVRHLKYKTAKHTQYSKYTLVDNNTHKTIKTIHTRQLTTIHTRQLTTLHTRQLTTLHTRHLKIQHVKKVNNTKVRKYCIQFLVFFSTYIVLPLSLQLVRWPEINFSLIITVTFCTEKHVTVDAQRAPNHKEYGSQITRELWVLNTGLSSYHHSGAKYLEVAPTFLVRGSNPGGEGRFSAPVQTGPGAHLASCTMGTGSLPGGKERPGHDAAPSSPSSAVVKKEQSYNSTPPMGRSACTEPQCLYKGSSSGRQLYIQLWFSMFYMHQYRAGQLSRYSD